MIVKRVLTQKRAILIELLHFWAESLWVYNQGFKKFLSFWLVTSFPFSTLIGLLLQENIPNFSITRYCPIIGIYLLNNMKIKMTISSVYQKPQMSTESSIFNPEVFLKYCNISGWLYYIHVLKIHYKGVIAYSSSIQGSSDNTFILIYLGAWFRIRLYPSH